MSAVGGGEYKWGRERERERERVRKLKWIPFFFHVSIFFLFVSCGVTLLCSWVGIPACMGVGSRLRLPCRVELVASTIIEILSWFLGRQLDGWCRGSTWVQSQETLKDVLYCLGILTTSAAAAASASSSSSSAASHNALQST